MILSKILLYFLKKKQKNLEEENDGMLVFNTVKKLL